MMDRGDERVVVVIFADGRLLLLEKKSGSGEEVER